MSENKTIKEIHLDSIKDNISQIIQALPEQINEEIKKHINQLIKTNIEQLDAINKKKS